MRAWTRTRCEGSESPSARHPKRSLLLALVLAAAVVVAAGAGAQTIASAASSDARLEPFKSDAQFVSYLRKLVETNRKWMTTERERQRREDIDRNAPLSCDPPARVSGGTIVNGANPPENSSRPTRIDFSGRVLDLLGRPVSGANVVVPAAGPSAGGNTNSDGRFRFTVGLEGVTKPLSVAARRIGFLPVRLDLPSRLASAIEIEFKLCIDATRLEQVIITGQGGPERGDGSRLDTEDEPTSGPVSVNGKFLVVLNRGRLFSVAIKNNELRMVSVADAFGPGIDPKVSYQQQVFIDNGIVVVAGPSDRLGGFEMSLYRLGSSGSLAHLNTYQLKLGRNAYRSAPEPILFTHGRLVFHTEASLLEDTASVLSKLPMIRKWHIGASDKEFEPMLRGRDAYRPARSIGEAEKPALHTVTACRVVGDELSCRASAVVATLAQSYYSSPNAAYVWPSPSQPFRKRGGVVLYRMPFDGASPSALSVDGEPAGPTAFFEEHGFFDAIVRRGATGDFASSAAGLNDLFLLRVPLSQFTASAPVAGNSRYRAVMRPLRAPSRIRYTYGSVTIGTPRTRSEGEGAGDVVTSVDLTSARAKTFGTLGWVQRIDAAGDKALVSTGRLGQASFITMSPTSISDSAFVSGLVQTSGEFDYRLNSDGTALSALVIRTPNITQFDELYAGNASLVFVQMSGSYVAKLGQITPTGPASVSDGCKSSCDDWYADAHSISVGDRIFAVLGYQLIEASVVGGKLVEKKRIDFFPGERK
jgi:hypothetical protein